MDKFKTIEIKEDSRPRDFQALQLRLASPEKSNLGLMARSKNQKL